MKLNPTGKIAILTGANCGVGKSIAQILSAAGMNLTLVVYSAPDEFSASLPSPACRYPLTYATLILDSARTL